MACCLEFSKNVTFFINCLIFLLSCVVGIGCILILTNITPALQEAINPPKLTTIFLLVMCVVSILISFCGCMGAAKGSPCMLVSYGAMLIAISIGFVVISALIMSFSKDIEKASEEGLDQLIKNYKPSDPSNSSKINSLDDIQQTFKCCGSRNLSSWDNYRKEHNDNYPSSCCADKKAECKQPFEKTCLTDVSKVLENGALVSTIAGFSIALVLFVSAVSSCLMARAFSDQRASITNQYGRVTV